MSKRGVFSGPYFPHSDWIRRDTPLDTFHAVFKPGDSFINQLISTTHDIFHHDEWWWIVFAEWLTDERHLALFSAWNIIRDPHHAGNRIQTCAEPAFMLSWMKLCSSDNHNTTTLHYSYESLEVRGVFLKISKLFWQSMAWRLNLQAKKSWYFRRSHMVAKKFLV